ncbi:MAG: hypothetical protein JJT90_18155 [Ectothiorhodospiraceae bacterium]|nr:hypothetical protein [Ectothiorhodospiraceae bacterium]
MDEPDKFVDLELDESLQERIRLHLELMDKHALNILRAVAELEYILSQAVQAKFKNQISAQKVVGDSFARLIRLAFALDVVGQKTFESLLNLKDIRNRVAHEVQPDIKVKDLLSIVLFLGKDAEGVVQEKGAYLAEWHQVSLDLLVDHVKSEILA